MKWLFHVIFISVLLTSATTNAYSCSCEGWSTKKKLHKAQLVFVGEVVEIANNKNTDPFLSVSIKFKVDRYWKGIKESYVTLVSAPPVCCTCGLAVQIGLKFLVYGFKLDDGQLETNLCTSEPLDSETATDELRVLGRAKILKPTGSRSQATPNKSLDASGGSVFLNLIGAAMLE
jgi:hypothetical protein